MRSSTSSRDENSMRLFTIGNPHHFSSTLLTFVKSTITAQLVAEISFLTAAINGDYTKTHSFGNLDSHVSDSSATTRRYGPISSFQFRFDKLVDLGDF